MRWAALPMFIVLTASLAQAQEPGQKGKLVEIGGPLRCER